MTIATGTPKDVKNQPRIGGGCGGCTYTFNSGTGCYDRQGAGGCTGACRCAPIICGLGSQVIQRLRPATVTSAAAVSLNCAVAASDDAWLVQALIDLAQQQIPAQFPWRRACIGLGVLSVALAIGLAAALLSR